MSDKSLGSLIFVLGLVGAIAYLYWLFAPADPDDILFFCPWIKVRWALVIPIVVVVLAVLVIAMWIGWTMAVTPPSPAILEAKSEENVNEKKPEEK
jgi:alpha-beta hydrolase superfamily lysophospholipase